MHGGPRAAIATADVIFAFAGACSLGVRRQAVLDRQLSRIIVFSSARRHHLAVDHVDDLKLLVMQLVGPGCAAILDDDHVVALVGEAPDRGGDALVGEDATAHDVADPEIMEQQAEIASGQRAVGHLLDDDLVADRLQFVDDLQVPVVARQEQVVPSRLSMAQRALAPVAGLARDPGEKARNALRAEAGQKIARVRNEQRLHALEEGRPEIVASPAPWAGASRGRAACDRCSGRRSRGVPSPRASAQNRGALGRRGSRSSDRRSSSSSIPASRPDRDQKR